MLKEKQSYFFQLSTPMDEEVLVVGKYHEVATLPNLLEDVFESKQGLPPPGPVDYVISVIKESKLPKLRAPKYPVAHT